MTDSSYALALSQLWLMTGLITDSWFAAAMGILWLLASFVVSWLSA